MKELQGEIAGLAVASAAKIVGKTADQDLYDQFLKEVGGSMKTQTTNSRMRCPLAAVRYARILYDLGFPENSAEDEENI